MSYWWFTVFSSWKKPNTATFLLRNASAPVLCGYSREVKTQMCIWFWASSLPSSCILYQRARMPVEYPEEQGQFSPGVNSKESQQETVEMDCRMEPPPPLLLRSLFSLTVYILPLQWHEHVCLANGELRWCKRGGRLYLDRAMVK